MAFRHTMVEETMKPLTTEPPLDPPVTEYDRIEARRFELYKKGLLAEEQQHDALLEQEYEWMQLLDDEEHYEY